MPEFSDSFECDGCFQLFGEAAERWRHPNKGVFCRECYLSVREPEEASRAAQFDPHEQMMIKAGNSLPANGRREQCLMHDEPQPCARCADAVLGRMPEHYIEHHANRRFRGLLAEKAKVSSDRAEFLDNVATLLGVLCEGRLFAEVEPECLNAIAKLKAERDAALKHIAAASVLEVRRLQGLLPNLAPVQRANKSNLRPLDLLAKKHPPFNSGVVEEFEYEPTISKLDRVKPHRAKPVTVDVGEYWEE